MLELPRESGTAKNPSQVTSRAIAAVGLFSFFLPPRLLAFGFLRFLLLAIGVSSSRYFVFGWCWVAGRLVT